MISRLLIEFNQNPGKKQDFKEHKLLTVKLLIIIKDQLFKNIHLIHGCRAAEIIDNSSREK
jgi:hypothetical protein